MWVLILGFPYALPQHNVGGARTGELHWHMSCNADGSDIRQQHVLLQRAATDSSERCVSRMRLTLPTPPWLRARLKQTNTSLFSEGSEHFVYALACVDPGIYFDDALSMLSHEAELQWTFMMWPADFFTAVVRELWVCLEPLEVFARVPVTRRNMV